MRSIKYAQCEKRTLIIQTTKVQQSSPVLILRNKFCEICYNLFSCVLYILWYFIVGPYSMDFYVYCITYNLDKVSTRRTFLSTLWRQCGVVHVYFMYMYMELYFCSSRNFYAVVLIDCITLLPVTSVCPSVRLSVCPSRTGF